jgi:VanZ family protein
LNVIRPLHFRKVWLFVGLMLVAAVIYLSLTASFPAYLVIDDDLKLNHVLAYAVLMLYFAQLIVSPRMAWGIAALFAIMGIVLEYLQGQTGYRTFSYYDMLANCLGISFGFIISKTSLVNSLAYIDRKIAAFF